ncbi:MAG: HAD domain-containing protein [Bacilli bacterium]|nr:HAD domain-containing protein [Bacilli bacterium]
MKVIFLDIDGVICLQNDENKQIENILNLNSDCCIRLKEILANTNARIVLTSSWRLADKYSLNKLYSKFTLYRISPFHFIGKTPNYPMESRGFEIRKWLESRSDIKDYIVLDDSYISEEYIPSSHFIQTASNQGITEKVKQLCIERLK